MVYKKKKKKERKNSFIASLVSKIAFSECPASFMNRPTLNNLQYPIQSCLYRIQPNAYISSLTFHNIIIDEGKKGKFLHFNLSLQPSK